MTQAYTVYVKEVMGNIKVARNRINRMIILIILREISHGWKTLLPSNPCPLLRVVPPVEFQNGAVTVSQHPPKTS